MVLDKLSVVKRSGLFQIVFVVLAVVVGVLGSVLFAEPFKGFVFGDLKLYYFWYQNVAVGEEFYGVLTAWVYPYLGLLPIMLAGFLGLGVQGFLSGWFLLNVVLYVVALLMFRSSFKDFKFAPYVVFVFTVFMLFGLFLQRLDGVAIALTVMALSLVREGRVGFWFVLLLSVGMWVKVWPVAFLVAGFFMVSSRLKYFVYVVVVNGLIVGVPLFFGGSLGSVFSFMGSQGGRGLQVESVYALPWVAGLGEVFFNENIMSFEVSGAGSEVVAGVANVLLLVALGLMVVLGFVFRERFVGDFEFLVLFGSVLVAVLIVFNKVGSPQFAGWLLVPLLFLSQFGFARFKVLIGFDLLGVVGTGLSAPVFYGAVLGQEWLGFACLLLKWVGIVGFMTVGIVTLLRMFKNQQSLLVDSVSNG